MQVGVNMLLQGLAGLMLSIVMWRLTGNWLAWAVLFSPAALLVLWGAYRVFKDD
jgi:hypothetical protein